MGQGAVQLVNGGSLGKDRVMDQGAVQKATRKAIWEEHQETVLDMLPGVGQGIPQAH